MFGKRGVVTKSDIVDTVEVDVEKDEWVIVSKATKDHHHQGGGRANPDGQPDEEKPDQDKESELNEIADLIEKPTLIKGQHWTIRADSIDNQLARTKSSTNEKPDESRRRGSSSIKKPLADKIREDSVRKAGSMPKPASVVKTASATKLPLATKPASLKKLTLVNKPASVTKPVSATKPASVTKTASHKKPALVQVNQPASVTKSSSVTKPSSVNKATVVNKPARIKKPVLASKPALLNKPASVTKSASPKSTISIGAKTTLRISDQKRDTDKKSAPNSMLNSHKRAPADDKPNVVKGPTKRQQEA
ncbi:hypothetical protein QBC46DRAFT_344437 [Diplogelasinospora grovesii]|uniref:Uncharacterized protein n=1 Tax=Diplogelasinospora grovesii TaxID=303347 RepID=A0AAN6N2J0_9PEZI|nr:hypothetical protein QBC46DRAFT_344437 [Diplogelasinospora grovesii]